MTKKFFQYWKPLLAVVFWGASFIATKIALKELSPLMIIFCRLILGIILLTVFAVITKREFSLNLKNHGLILILALVASFHLWIQVTGLQYTTASNTGWIIGVTPVFMVLLGLIFFKEKLLPLQLTGIIISFAGLLLLISRGKIGNIGLLSHKGDFMVLASAFTWSVYSMVNKKITINYSPVMTILFLFLMMIIIISPFTLTAENIHAAFNLSAKGWAAVLFLGIFCSGVAYVLWAQSLKTMNASSVGAFLYLEPFVTVFVAWLLLSEIITALMILSGLIIMLGVVLVNRK